MRILPLLLLLIGLAQTVSVHAQKRSMLVYTKNGKGYVHDNIPAAVEALKQIGQDEKIKVVVSDEPGIFTEEQLKQFSLLVFPSTNNDVFDTDAQRLAFRRYIEAGGGLVGIHSITGTERNWTWFKMLIGCTFSWHANFQTFTVRVTDPQHPSMKDVPLLWQREDELYFGKELYPVTNVMMSHQISTLHPKQKEQIQKNAGTYLEYYPAVWYNRFQGGHAWVTTLGHSKESYQDPVFVNHLRQGIRFIAATVKPPDFSNAYAQHKDDPILK
ncbi:MAG: ThuA domain-containing protein [Bacteroidota bacterium]